MGRSNNQNARERGMILETAQLCIGEILAISAAITIGVGGPYAIVLDPASTSRNVTLYTPTVTALMHEHELFNISSGTGNLVVKDPTGVTTLGTVKPGERAILRWVNSTVGWLVYNSRSGSATQSTAAKVTLQQYTTLAALANSQVFDIAIPFGFTLTSIGFRTRIAASTANKLATLTARVNDVAVTGGVLALTTANQNTSGALTAGTAITAGNAGTAGQTAGCIASAVTAFVEGDGYIEYGLTNTDLVA